MKYLLKMGWIQLPCKALVETNFDYGKKRKAISFCTKMTELFLKTVKHSFWKMHMQIAHGCKHTCVDQRKHTWACKQGYTHSHTQSDVPPTLQVHMCMHRHTPAKIQCTVFSLLSLDCEFLKEDQCLIHLSSPTPQFRDWNRREVQQSFVKFDQTQAHTWTWAKTILPWMHYWITDVRSFRDVFIASAKIRS